MVRFPMTRHLAYFMPRLFCTLLGICSLAPSAWPLRVLRQFEATFGQSFIAGQASRQEISCSCLGQVGAEWGMHRAVRHGPRLKQQRVNQWRRVNKRVRRWMIGVIIEQQSRCVPCQQSPRVEIAEYEYLPDCHFVGRICQSA